MYRIFLSHSGRDSSWVKWIRFHAINIGIEVYLYEYDSQPGSILAEKIKNAIQNSDALVVLLTQNSLISTYVHQEIGFAEACKKLIIPLVQPGISNDRLAMLQGREYILFDFLNPEDGLLSLLNYLQRLKKAKEKEQVFLMGIIGTIIFLALVSEQKKN